MPRGRGRAWPSSTPWWATRDSAGATCSRPPGRTSCAGWAGTTRPPPSTGPPSPERGRRPSVRSCPAAWRRCRAPPGDRRRRGRGTGSGGDRRLDVDGEAPAAVPADVGAGHLGRVDVGVAALRGGRVEDGGHVVRQGDDPRVLDAVPVPRLAAHHLDHLRPVVDLHAGRQQHHDLVVEDPAVELRGGLPARRQGLPPLVLEGRQLVVHAHDARLPGPDPPNPPPDRWSGRRAAVAGEGRGGPAGPPPQLLPAPVPRREGGGGGPAGG